VTDRASALATLREPNFRFYFLSRLVNGAGSTMGGIALVFAVLEVSSSPSALGLVLAAHTVPEVALTLFGGVIADRFGRTLVIQVCNVLAGMTQLAIAGLVISGSAQLWQLVVLSAVNGTVAAISFPALASVMPQLVPHEQLQPANVLMSMQRGIVSVVGPAVGGVLVVTVGAGWAVAIDGLTYLAAAAMLLLVRVPPPLPPEERTSTWDDLREGWRYFRSTTWLWVVVLAFCMLNALHAGAFFTLGPLLAKSGSIGEAGWGLILSAGAAGLLLTTFVMLKVTLQRPLFWGMLGCALFGVPMVVLAVHPDLGWMLAASVLGGAGLEVFNLGWNLAMQEQVRDEMLSRAYAYDSLGSWIAMPIGQLAAGPLAVAFGTRHTILAAGILYFVLCLATLGSRSVRDLQRVSTTSRPASG
jgi:MFS family permease